MMFLMRLPLQTRYTILSEGCSCPTMLDDDEDVFLDSPRLVRAVISLIEARGSFWACGRLEGKLLWMGTRSTTTMVAIFSAFRRPFGSMRTIDFAAVLHRKEAHAGTYERSLPWTRRRGISRTR